MLRCCKCFSWHCSAFPKVFILGWLLGFGDRLSKCCNVVHKAFFLVIFSILYSRYMVSYCLKSKEPTPKSHDIVVPP